MGEGPSYYHVRHRALSSLSSELSLAAQERPVVSALLRDLWLGWGEGADPTGRSGTGSAGEVLMTVRYGRRRLRGREDPFHLQQLVQ